MSNCNDSQKGNHPGAVGRTGARTSDQPFLIFCFFLIKQKEKEEGEDPINKKYCKRSMQISKPAVAGITFFSLDGKEPKDQECRIASGRHSALRAWVVTVQVFTILTLFWLAFCHFDQREKSSSKFLILI